MSESSGDWSRHLAAHAIADSHDDGAHDLNHLHRVWQTAQTLLQDHAEADALPGVVIDRFGDAAVIQPNAAWAEAHIDALAAALRAVTGVTTVIKNGTGRSRSLEGLTEETATLSGGASAPIPVPMNGATYMADLVGGQKTGLFFDQRPNHVCSSINALPR